MIVNRFHIAAILTVLLAVSADARIISYSPLSLEFPSTGGGDTSWINLRIRYSGADQGVVLVEARLQNPERGFHFACPHLAPVYGSLDSIRRASFRYANDHGGRFPRTYGELAQNGYIRLPDEILSDWSFTLVGQDPITQIEAASTPSFPEGAGHVIIHSTNPQDVPFRG